MRTTTTLFRRGLAAVLATGALAAAPYPAHAAAPDRSDRTTDVRIYDYDLGDRAMTVQGFNSYDRNGMPAKRLAPIELTGRVYAPAGAAGERLPMVLIAHGLFWTCANDRTGKVDAAWPCRPGKEGIHSDQGYDYLGRTLAGRGMVVVSVGANGVNAGELGQAADRARAAVVYQHLRMWRRLVENGGGPLAGELHDVDTGATPRLRHAVDLRNVGLMGHSRGGRGVMWAAADTHRDRWPEGVRIRAVFGMASAEPPFMDRGFKRLQVTKVPLMTWAGTCDATGRDEYNRLARRGGNPVNIGITVHGANHNNLNTRWAAGGGPGGEDDAGHPEGRPGRCDSGFGGPTSKTLGPRQERQVAATYVEAFFGRYLQADRSFDAVLSGRRKPVQDLARVDVRSYRRGR